MITTRFSTEFLTLIRFGIVGLASTLTHVVAVGYFLYLAKVSLLLANGFAFLTAFTISFIGHYYWTFQVTNKLSASLRRFFLISSSAFLFNSLILKTIASQHWVSDYSAAILSAFLVPAYTFTLSRLWGFAKHERN